MENKYFAEKEIPDNVPPAATFRIFFVGFLVYRFVKRATKSRNKIS